MKRQSIIQGFPTCVPLLIFVGLTFGCAIGPTMRTYKGDRLQKSEVAVIKGFLMFDPLGYEGVDIYAVDGNNL